jgi:hypothetical protein
MKREDYLEQTFAGPVIISAQSNRRSYDAPYATQAIASLHVNERGCNAFPLTLLEQAGPLLPEASVQANLSTEASGYLNLIDATGGDLFHHALAIMHTPAYRIQNAGAVLGDWPRIPLPASAEELSRSAGLGRRIAELLDPESSVPLGAAWSSLGRLVLRAPPDLAEHLRVTAVWGYRGQAGAVMPGRGLAVERPWDEGERQRLSRFLRCMRWSRA